MKVTNPNPCLINVAVDGDYVRIGPGRTADVPKEAVESLLKSGALVPAGRQAASEPESEAQKSPSEMRAGELKAELDKLGVEYAGNASTEVLRGLYEAKLAEPKE
ncbi:hypothetical protein CSC67_08660 [Pusillimonas caeni]|uniref:hypothetical protein n=1 Tax=Pusillimonas caeni TaxID=1348472 RepID=UPI000E59E1C7|nr:hypothetical protein [Pusillimonas caeni]TFL14213.1 hypothetical protein CSC67_08660 [Pusillimonas caeni]